MRALHRPMPLRRVLRSVPEVAVAILAIACMSDPDPGDVVGDPTAEVAESGPIACADPGARSVARWDRKQADEQPIPGAYCSGGGLAVDDLDGDGRMDLFAPSEQTVQLWWGSGGGLFDEDAAASLASATLDMAVGAVPVDYDGDGDLDLFVTRWEAPNALLRNDGGRAFTDVSVASGLAGPSTRHQSASWADIDADGDLDLFVGTYGQWTIVLDGESAGGCDDHLPDPAELYRNEGDGTFTDISDLLPPEVHAGYTFASGFYDLDDDSFPELFVSNDDGLCGPSVLVDNVDGSTFTVDAGSQFHPASHDMGMAVGDLNDDELPDFALTSWKTVAVLRSTASDSQQNGALWIDAGSSLGITVDPTGDRTQHVYGWGAEFGDVDNDADLDLAMTFGYWSTYDGDGDPLRQADGLWIQGADGQFSNQAAAYEIDDNGISRSVVFADLNDDGWLDVSKRILDGVTPMYQSRCGAESWLRLRLVGEGANTRAVGARVRLYAGGVRQVRWQTAGSSGMYTGSPQELHFGLGAVEAVDRIDVVWPDGLVTTNAFDGGLAARQVVTLTHP
ncbi:MAG: CRTAC1 family protein [Myxococcota bacterium]